MIVVVDGADKTRDQELRQMFRLRATVFKDQLGWDVNVDAEGLERDYLDDRPPVYLIDVEAGKVMGAMRLLPSTGPILHDNLFHEQLISPEIWEVSRICIDPTLRRTETMAVQRQFAIGLGLVAEIACFDTVIGALDDGMLRLYKAMGFEVEVISTTRDFGEPIYAALFNISPEVLNRVKTRIGH